MPSGTLYISGRARWNMHVSARHREVYCQLPGNDVHVRPGSGKLMFDRHLGLFFGTIRRQMREVEQPYNNGDLQHVHQTIYLWTIKFA